MALTPHKRLLPLLFFKKLYYNINIGGNMEKIIGALLAFKEDNPQVVITDEIIKEFIEENIGELVNEISNEL